MARRRTPRSQARAEQPPVHLAAVVRALARDEPANAPVRRWLQLHLTTAARGLVSRSGRELARRLQQARGAERRRLIAELARLDAWAWRSGTSNRKTILQRERRIKESLDNAGTERLVYDPVTKRGRRVRPRIDLDGARWEIWFRHSVQMRLTQYRKPR